MIHSSVYKRCGARNPEHLAEILLAQLELLSQRLAEQQAAEPVVLQPMKWLPIEMAPQDGTEILGYRNGRIATACRVPRDDCEMWTFAGTTAAIDIAPHLKPTHWMPLPAPPIEAAHNITGSKT